MRKYLYLVLFVLGMVVPTMAQTAIRSYNCDFEDAGECSRWVLNPQVNPNFVPLTKWYIGELGAIDGKQGLYVSADNGASVSYNASKSSLMVAYRELTLEAGDYDFTANWCNLGHKDNAYMIMAWIPQSDWLQADGIEWITSGSNTNWSGNEALNNNKLIFTNRSVTAAERLYNSDSWTWCSAHIHSDGTPHRLVIVWVNEATSSTSPYAMVDNIQIARNMCGEPTDLSVTSEGSTVTLRWQGGAEAYNLKYRIHGESESTEINNIQNTEITLSLPHGLYDFYVQNICKGDLSVWYGFPITVVYENSCFDFLNLEDEQCFFSGTSSAGLKTDFSIAKRIDNGYDDPTSAHTMHYVQGEIDPLTLNSTDRGSQDPLAVPVPPLKTIPDGELASIRIGSKEVGKAARIVYDYTIDAKEASVLMIKYACVLEMAGHDGDQQPRFILNVKDALTGDILEPCSAVDFSPKKNQSTEGWNYTGDVKSATTLAWKDWTTVGINLDKYDGKTVRVELSVYGCTLTGHRGYAYFTLKCTKGTIEGINCGDTPTTEFAAPEGFHYRWYKAFDPEQVTLETDGGGNPLAEDSRVFHVDYRDTTTYKVDVIYLTDEHCGFTLTASALPRYPIPEATWEYVPKDCKNYVRFTNTSHIRTKNIIENTWTDTDMRPEAFTWNFGNGTPLSVEWEPIVEFPAEGGTFNVELNASVGLCDSTQLMTVTLPRVGDTIVAQQVQRCEGDSYSFQGRTYVSDTTLTMGYHTLAGCDSTYVLNLHFVDKVEMYVDTVIPEGEVYMLGNRALTQSGEYVSEGLESAMGCDSVVYLTLRVVPKLRVENTYVEYPCANQTECLLNFIQRTGKISKACLFFDATALAGGFVNTELPLNADEQGNIEFTFPLPENVRPDWYAMQVVFDSDENGRDTINVEFMVRYAADIIAQRWNQVLGVHNAEHNGGYDFVAYQWYRNGEPLSSATEPYYYTADDLDTEADYAVELFREGEVRGVLSCSYSPSLIHARITVSPTVLEAGSVLTVTVPEEASLQIFDVMGNAILTTTLVVGVNQLQPQLLQGCYVLRLKTTRTGQIQTLMLQGK